MDKEKFQFKCDFCEKSFFNEEILGLHIKSNHKSIIEGWKKCDICERNCSSKDSLQAHLRKTHSNAKRLLTKKYLLDRHKKSVHERIKSFKCNSCEKEFTAKWSMIMHISAIPQCTVNIFKGLLIIG